MAIIDLLTDLIRSWRQPGRPLVVGLCGPQGSGKSTLAGQLSLRLDSAGLRAPVLSLDDLYLTHSERARLGRDVHPLLSTRGTPGTHDVRLGLRTLTALSRSGRVNIPRFDKSRDDRAPESDWDAFAGPADVILFEGWCAGARPQPGEALAEPVNALERDEDRDGRWRAYVNAALAGDYQELFACIDRLVLLQAPNFEVVQKWRLQQEHALRDRLANTGDPGRAMSDVEVARFVQYYERLTRWIAQEAPTRADLVVPLDAERRDRSGLSQRGPLKPRQWRGAPEHYVPTSRR